MVGGAYAATSVLRGRPRGRLRATISPWTKSSPPQTPHGSRRWRAPERHSSTCRARAAEGLGELDTVGGVGEPQLGVVLAAGNALAGRLGRLVQVEELGQLHRVVTSLLGAPGGALASSRCAGCGAGYSVGGRCGTAGWWSSSRWPRVVWSGSVAGGGYEKGRGSRCRDPRPRGDLSSCQTGGASRRGYTTPVNGAMASTPVVSHVRDAAGRDRCHHRRRTQCSPERSGSPLRERVLAPRQGRVQMSLPALIAIAFVIVVSIRANPPHMFSHLPRARTDHARCSVQVRGAPAGRATGLFA